MSAQSRLHAEECVGEFRLFVGHLAYVVEQSGATGLLGIETEFRSHNGTEIGSLA